MSPSRILSTSLYAALALPLIAAAADLPQFNQDNVRATIKTLSSDPFGGRAPGSAGERLTTDYISGKFREYGLVPADHGSYLQEVPLKQITADPGTNLTVSGGSAPLHFAYGSDMIVSSPRTDASVSLRASPLVFAGYGVVAPEYGWNDYAGLDVKGKTVVVLVNDPGHADGTLFDGKAMTYYGRWTYKYEEAARQGAAGILIVHEQEPAGYPWEVVQGSWSGPLEELPPGKEYLPAIQGWITHDAAEKLFSAAGLKFDELENAAARRGFKAVPLKLTADITLKDTVKDIVSHNVVGLVKGATRPDEVVIYSAHWDHLGEHTVDGKDEIFHGAVDNASGISGLLELARVYAAGKAPARSVLFIATTCEEQGLLGARYYAAHPLFALKDTVGDLNMDVLDTYGKTRDVTLRGARFMSGLDDTLAATAQAQGLSASPDSDPAKGYYFRADHFEFAKVGVPALSISLGNDYVGRPSGWGTAQHQDYVAHRYHKPADLYDPSWDLTGLVQQLDLMYQTGHGLADGGSWPVWKGSGPFAAARKAQGRQ